MIRAIMIASSLAAQVEAAYAVNEIDSSRSLAAYLGSVVIDCSPEPRRWADVWEPWQVEIVRPMVPAIEQVMGYRSGYDGPRHFWYTLPRGCDKTGLQGRISNGVLGFGRRPVRGAAVAADRDQARLMRDSMEAEAALNPWLARRLNFNNYVVRGQGGSFDILSSDYESNSGRRDSLSVCDEPTTWKSRGMFDMQLSGSIKTPDSVFVVITNAGVRGSWQWDVKEQAKSDPNWHVYESPPGRHPASWLNHEDIASARSLMTTSHARRVFDNVWTNQTDSAILSAELVEERSRPAREVLWPGEAIPRGYKSGPLYLGFDVGRSQDVSAVAVFERCRDGSLPLRVLRVMKDTGYRAQKDYVRGLMKRLGHRVAAGQIDKGGIGHQLAEELTHEFPVLRGVACSSKWQGQAAVKMQLAFRSGKAVIPDLPDLQFDLQQVEEAEVGSGGMSVIRTNRSDLGHADRFWGCALAIDAMPTNRSGPLGRPSVGKPPLVNGPGSRRRL
ncbi:MAG: hypothetical protein AAGJ97_00450 [Planctomycetota bacterium]